MVEIEKRFIEKEHILDSSLESYIFVVNTGSSSENEFESDEDSVDESVTESSDKEN